MEPAELKPTTQVTTPPATTPVQTTPPQTQSNDESIYTANQTTTVEDSSSSSDAARQEQILQNQDVFDALDDAYAEAESDDIYSQMETSSNAPRDNAKYSATAILDTGVGLIKNTQEGEDDLLNKVWTDTFTSSLEYVPEQTQIEITEAKASDIEKQIMDAYGLKTLNSYAGEAVLNAIVKNGDNADTFSDLANNDKETILAAIAQDITDNGSSALSLPDVSLSFISDNKHSNIKAIAEQGNNVKTSKLQTTTDVLDLAASGEVNTFMDLLNYIEYDGQTLKEAIEGSADHPNYAAYKDSRALAYSVAEQLSITNPELISQEDLEGMSYDDLFALELNKDANDGVVDLTNLTYLTTRGSTWTAPTNEEVETPVVEEEPVIEETVAPSEAPSEIPSEAPTEAPSEAPTEAPTEAPVIPTEAPTEAPVIPTEAPTEAPVIPTEAPTEAPVIPTEAPTEAPVIPTEAPPCESTPDPGRDYDNEIGNNIPKGDASYTDTENTELVIEDASDDVGVVAAAASSTTTTATSSVDTSSPAPKAESSQDTVAAPASSDNQGSSSGNESSSSGSSGGESSGSSPSGSGGGGESSGGSAEPEEKLRED